MKNICENCGAVLNKYGDCDYCGTHYADINDTFGSFPTKVIEAQNCYLLTDAIIVNDEDRIGISDDELLQQVRVRLANKLSQEFNKFVKISYSYNVQNCYTKYIAEIRILR